MKRKEIKGPGAGQDVDSHAGFTSSQPGGRHDLMLELELLIGLAAALVWSQELAAPLSLLLFPTRCPSGGFFHAIRSR